VREPLDYPWDVATTPFVVRANGVTWGEAPIEAGAVAIVASGSNASPTRLHEKLGAHLGGRAVAGVPCVVTDFTPVFSAHFTAYGAVPATLARDRGACARLICLHVPAGVLAALHRSEAVGRNYGFYRLDGAVVRSTEGDRVEAPHSYLSLHGTLQIDGAPRRLGQFAVEGSRYRTSFEPTILLELMRLLGQAGSAQGFAARLAAEAAFRAAMTDALQRRFARPLDGEGISRVA